MLQSPTMRAALAFACLSAWLVLIFTGIVLGKAVYLLLVAALVLFPWKWLRKPETGEALQADPSPIDAE